MRHGTQFLHIADELRLIGGRFRTEAETVMKQKSWFFSSTTRRREEKKPTESHFRWRRNDPFSFVTVKNGAVSGMY